MTLSVVITVYNGERYIEECVESIIHQLTPQCELIIIDDGSTDTTYEICSRFECENVRVIKQQNIGTGLSRKRGCEEARGEYIVFVDADDWVCKAYIETIFSVIGNNPGVDLIQFGHFVNNTEIPLPQQKLNREEFLKEVVMKTIVNGKVLVAMWDKIYKRKLLLESVMVWKGKVFEDYLTNAQYYKWVNQYVSISDSIYHYRVVPTSVSRTFNKESIAMLLDVDRAKLNLLADEAFSIVHFENYECESANWLVFNLQNILLNMCTKDKLLSKKEKLAIVEACLANPYLADRAKLSNLRLSALIVSRNSIDVYKYVNGIATKRKFVNHVKKLLRIKR